MVSLVNNSVTSTPVGTNTVPTMKIGGLTSEQWTAGLAAAGKKHSAAQTSATSHRTPAAMPGKSSAETRSVQAKTAKATADADTKDLGATPLQKAGNWVQEKLQATTTSAGRIFNAAKDQATDTNKAQELYSKTGDTTKLNQLDGRAAYRLKTTMNRIGRDFSDGPDRASQSTGADVAAKSGKLITSMGHGNVKQAKTNAAELEKTTSSLPSGAAKNHLREKTDQIQDNLQLGTGTKQGTRSLASDTSTLSKGITSNVTNVNMRINTLSAGNVQSHSRTELISNYKSLASRIDQMPAGEVKQNMQNSLKDMKQSVYTGSQADVASGIRQLRSVSTSAEATANDTLQQTHKIVKGDTLTKVMADKSIDPSQRSAILRLNNITTKSLTPGQTIILPSKNIST